MNLAGTRVVVTRPERQAGSVAERLEQLGADVLLVPTIETLPPESWTEVDDSIRELAAGGYGWVAFTSANGVEGFLARLGCSPEEVFKKAKVAAVGSATERALRARGVTPDLVPATFSAVALAEALGEGSGRILLPRAASVPPTMMEALTANGWEPHEVVTYRTNSVVPEGAAAAEVAAGRFDVVTFTSASTVAGFAAAFDIGALGLVPGTTGSSEARVVACIGPVTAAECGEQGLRVDLIAAPATAEGLISGLQTHI